MFWSSDDVYNNRIMLDADAERAALRTKLEKLELAISAVIDPIVWVDAQGRIEWFSAPFRRLVEKADTELLGAMLLTVLPLEERGQPLPEGAHPVLRALHGQPNAIGHYEFRRSDRTAILEILAARVQVSKQELSTVVAIRDVTERKQAEELVKRRAAELDKAYQELKDTQAMLVQAEKMAAIGELASGVAHEVKNPLGIILQGVSYLELEITPEQANLHDVLQMIKEAVRRSDKIVRDLLNFSRHAPLESKPEDMAGVVDSALNLVEKQLALKDVKITRAYTPGLPPVLLDENQMKQVLINIILNALHAMPNGGELTLRLSLKQLDQVQPGVGRRTGDVFKLGQTVLVCEITDTGTGIPEDVLGKVFDPFFTTKPAGEGTGLGLAITREIVERHRGRIDITSQKGRGTTLRIALPIHEAPT